MTKTFSIKKQYVGREFADILGYKKWDNFRKVIKKAKDQCEAQGYSVDKHFKQFAVKGETGRPKKDYTLTTKAMYYIVNNADQKKKDVQKVRVAIDQLLEPKTAENKPVVTKQVTKNNPRAIIRIKKHDDKYHELVLNDYAQEIYEKQYINENDINDLKRELDIVKDQLKFSADYVVFNNKKKEQVKSRDLTKQIQKIVFSKYKNYNFGERWRMAVKTINANRDSDQIFPKVSQQTIEQKTEFLELLKEI